MSLKALTENMYGLMLEIKQLLSPEDQWKDDRIEIETLGL